MSDKVTRNDVPGVDAVKAALFGVLASGRSRSFANVSGDVAKALGLTRGQRAYRIGGSKNTLFENRLVQARAELVKEGAISYKAGKVRLEARDAVSAGRGAANAGAASATGEPKTAGKPKGSGAVSTTGKPKAPVKSKAPDDRPTRCLCIREPFASYVVSGVKDAEFRAWKVNVPVRDLVICASKTPSEDYGKIPGLAYGLAIGMVDVVECVGREGDYVWKLERPRLIKPFAVRGSVGFFRVAEIPEVIPNDAGSYREHVLPHCLRGSRKEEDDMVASLYAPSADWLQKKYRVYWQKFDHVKGGYR